MMGVFSMIKTAPQLGLEDPGRFGWQSKDFGYGNQFRILATGEVEQHEIFIEDGEIVWDVWYSVPVHGKYSIYSIIQDEPGRYVEYSLTYQRGSLVKAEKVYDGKVSERWKHESDV